MPMENAGSRLKINTGAHFKRPSPRTSSGDNDILMPGSPRRVRHKHGAGETGSVDATKTKTAAESKVDANKRQTGPGTLTRRCSHEFCKRKSSDEVFVKSKPALPDKATKGPQKPERRRATGFGYPTAVEKVFIDIPDSSSDEEEPEPEVDNLALYRKLEDSQEKDQKERATQLLLDQYRKVCSMEHVTPCGRFQRQISSPVVDLSCSQLGTKDLKTICVLMAANYSIKDLDLSGNDMSGKCAKYLTEALRENTSVEDLTLAQCNLDLDSLKTIADLFLDMKPMKRLDLSSNKFSIKHAEVIADVIQKNDYIEDFVLAGNEFDDQGGVLLGKALVKNVGIKKLDLSWNHIRLSGATAVCMALKHNTTLEELDLSWNGLALEGCHALGLALPHNHTLKDLDISCNRINIFSLKELFKGLANNDTLHVLRIDQNPLTTDGAIALMQSLTMSQCSQLTDIHMIDIPINEEFLETLDELLKVHNVRVYHRDPNRKRITPILRERTLKDYDPAMILFEYMKQENLRLIDLFRTFDTDGDQSVSKEELREGFVTINMPLSDDALEMLFDKLDVNENEQIEYDEVKVGYRKTMKKLRSTDAQVPHNEAAVRNLKRLIKDALVEKRREMKSQAKEKLKRRSSLTAIFQIQKKNTRVWRVK